MDPKSPRKPGRINLATQTTIEHSANAFNTTPSFTDITPSGFSNPNVLTVDKANQELVIASAKTGGGTIDVQEAPLSNPTSWTDITDSTYSSVAVVPRTLAASSGVIWQGEWGDGLIDYNTPFTTP